MKYLVATLLALVPVAALAQSERITVTGTWNQIVQSVEAAYLSDTPMTLDVRARGRPGRSWYVEVARSEAGWHPDFVLELSLDGGRSFQKIEIDPALLMEGTGHIDDSLQLQYRLSGMSVDVPAGTYTTNVSFTITFVD